MTGPLPKRKEKRKEKMERGRVDATAAALARHQAQARCAIVERSMIRYEFHINVYINSPRWSESGVRTYTRSVPIWTQKFVTYDHRFVLLSQLMLPVHSQGRAGHRRACYESTGAFAALAALPRRTVKKPTFHFEDDDGSSSPPSAVPFPRSSPLHSPSLTRSPTVQKPLKSSLKSCSSSPNIPFPPQSLVPSIMFPDLHPKQQHQRASSAPCSPLLVSSSPPSTSSSSASSSSLQHHVAKNVHFPSQEEGGLATIRVFNRSARPASLSRLGEETETDTDGEASATGYGNSGWPGWSGKYVGGSTFPFPRVPPANAEKRSPLNPSKQKKFQYDIDWSASSVIPRKNLNRANENVFFESLQVVGGDDDGMAFAFLFRFPLILSQKRHSKEPS